MAGKQKIVLAYSGGLDTSYCVPYLREKKGFDVITVIVDTGGFSADELRSIEERARALGSVAHHTVDARQRVFDRYASYLIKGNVLRGDVYPLSVAAERVVQAQVVAEVALQEKAQAVAHGSTGAGNDQVRFDIAFGVLLPGLPILTPIRDERLSRDEEFSFLESRGVRMDKKMKEYSINVGLWGATIGGGVIHDSWQEIPADVYDQAAPGGGAVGPEDLTLGFEKGIPVSLDGRRLPGVEIVKELSASCHRHSVGRGIHIGDTVLGIKGGAALVLIQAHRELEKITTTSWQRFWKDHVAEFYGKMLHEGHAFDPVLRDIEALIDSSQERVDGDAKVRLSHGSFSVVGVQSPCTMVRAASGVYGEMPKLWSGEDVRGFSTIAAIPSRLHRQAGEGEKK
jgi:argininosuccinate synthase